MDDRLTIYHGSQNIIETPVFGFGKKDNDYGRGFYTTKDAELAKEWACQNNTDGFLNEYTLNKQGLNILYLNSKRFSILHWITMLLQNREVDDIENEEALQFLIKNYSINVENYDVIVGYRADDSYFSFARDFVNDGITLQSLCNAMVLGKLGIQFMIKSQKAFDALIYKKSYPVSKKEFYKRFSERDAKARNQYRLIKRAPKTEGILLTEILKNPHLIHVFDKTFDYTMITGS